MSQLPNAFDCLGYTYDATAAGAKYADDEQLLPVLALNGLQSNAKKTNPVVINGKTYAIPVGVIVDQSQVKNLGKTEFGSSKSDYSRSLSVSASVAASYGCFGGSVSGSFTLSEAVSTETYYSNMSSLWYLYRAGFALSDINIHSTNLGDSNLDFCISEELDNAFKNSSYQPDDTGANALKFFREVGTHMLASIAVGGKATQSFTGSQSNFSSSQDFQVCAEARYDSIANSGTFTTSVSGQSTKHVGSVQNAESFEVIGGSESTRSAYEQDPSNDNLMAWEKTVDDYPAWIDYAGGGSIPLWELCPNPAMQNYLETVFNQMYNPKLHTTNKTKVQAKAVTGVLEPNTGAPYRSVEFNSADEVMVGIGGSVDDHVHLKRLVVISLSLTTGDYKAYFDGGNKDDDWQTFYMAPEGSVITGIAVREANNSFYGMEVTTQKLQRCNLKNVFLDPEKHVWNGGPGKSSSSRIDMNNLQGYGSWTRGGSQDASVMQMDCAPASSGQKVLVGIRLVSSGADQHKGFCNLEVWQADLTQ